jgi:Cu-Zn family superoxide dismutase
MLSFRTSVAAAAAVVVVPTAAVAAQVLVDHGHGPTVTHDAAYTGIATQVHAWTRGESTRVRLMVEGLPPGRTFGAHVHTGRCGTDPLASGGHYQHSTDAAVPLAQREVWLDVTSDAKGRGVSTTTVPWSFEPGTAGSVVIHALPTSSTTGAAGARLACTTVDFGGEPGHTGE